MVVLFSQGLLESDIKVCVQSGHPAEVLSYEKNKVYDDCCVVMITCRRDDRWKNEELISVSNGSSIGAPSTAILRSDTDVPSGSKYYLCAITMIKNASRFLPDWVRYHRRIGIDRFYVLDNSSPDLDQLAGQLEDVELIPWPWKRSQHAAFTYGGLVAKSRCTWIVYFDVDEYIHPRSPPSLAALVREHDAPPPAGAAAAGALRLPTLLMTAPDLRLCPPSGVVEGYLHRRGRAAALHTRGGAHVVKAVCRAAAAGGLHRVHHCATPGAPQPLVNESRAYVVHYSHQCWRDFYAQKLRHGRSGVADWPAPAGLSEAPPASHWLFGLPGGYTVRDPEFRDFHRRTMAGPAPPPPTLVAR
jgi:hypothetical protein